LGVGMRSRYWAMADEILAFGGGAFASAAPLQTSNTAPESRTVPSRERALIRFTTPSMIVTLLAAAVIFWVSYDGGSYSVTSRTTLAIGVWWAVIVGLLTGLLPRAGGARRALVPGLLLAAYA